jgi:hypothetical protein
MTQAYAPPHDLPDGPRPRNIARLSAIVITLLAVLVATAAYFAGRSLKPGEDARARVAVAEPPAEVVPAAQPAAEPEPPPQPARPSSPFNSFDLTQLHPLVAEAVAQARAVQDEAMTAALRAEAAERRAQAGAPGTSIIMMENGDVFAGEVDAGADGDKRAQGAGVYTWANPQEDNYAGDFVDGAMEGLGVKRWTDGAMHYGERRQEAREGFGVFVDSTGGGYEGAWSNGAPDGYGVAWNADGTVRSQGRWSGNTLIEAWVVPTPVPTTDGTATTDAAPEAADALVDASGTAEPATPGAAALADGAGLDSGSAAQAAAPDQADGAAEEADVVTNPAEGEAEVAADEAAAVEP